MVLIDRHEVTSDDHRTWTVTIDVNVKNIESLTVLGEYSYQSSELSASSLGDSFFSTHEFLSYTIDYIHKKQTIFYCRAEKHSSMIHTVIKCQLSLGIKSIQSKDKYHWIFKAHGQITLFHRAVRGHIIIERFSFKSFYRILNQWIIDVLAATYKL